jgi:hypothetical protein
MSIMSSKGDSSQIPRGGNLYSIFGEGTNLSEFSPLVDRLDKDTLKLLSSVAVRISLVEALSSLNHFPSNRDFASLQLYLLCTCIDALANPRWLAFNEWLATKKAEYHTTERDTKLEEVFDELKNKSDNQFYVKSILELYSEYLNHYGTTRKFGAFFLDLPDFMKEFIASSYQIFNGYENFLKPEIWQKWNEKTTDEKLGKIANYIFEYRRNQFTHAGRTYQTTWESYFHSPKEALDTRPYKPSGSFLNFWADDNPDNDVELIVNVQHNEIFLLQTAIITYCRKVIGIIDEEHFLLKRKARYHCATMIKSVLYELQHNWKTYKFYSSKLLVYENEEDRYYGMPEFQIEWLEGALELDFCDYGVPEDVIIRETKSAILLLKNLNEPIRKVNEKYPPLYIRNRDKSLADKPEDFEGKKRAKMELPDKIQAMYDYRRAGWQIPNLLSIYARLLIEVPDQKGPKMYTTSRPDFFNLM